MVRFGLNMLISIMKSLDHMSVVTAMPLLNQDERTQHILTHSRCSPEKGFFFFKADENKACKLRLKKFILFLLLSQCNKMY